MADIQVNNQGTVIGFTPLTEEGTKWLEEKVDAPDWSRMGNTIWSDHRCAGAIIQGAQDDGLVVEPG